MRRRRREVRARRVGRSGCAGGARRLIKDEALKQLEDKARTAKITIDGDKATVETITDDPEDKSNLVREDARWLVDADSDSG